MTLDHKKVSKQPEGASRILKTIPWTKEEAQVIKNIVFECHPL
jgi:hypothetical protein